MRIFLCAFLFLLATVASAQEAIIFKMPSGDYIGYTIVNGEIVPLTNILVLEMPAPVKVKSAMIVMETVDRDAKMADLLFQIRMKTKVLILDKDAKTPDGEPLPLMKAALEEIGDTPLPCVVGRSSDGVVVHKKLPDTVEGFKAILKEWGLD